MITARLSPRPARSIASASPSISAVEHGVPGQPHRRPGPALGPQPFRPQRERHDRVGPHEHVALRPHPDAAHLPARTAGCLTRERVADRADARDTPVAVAQSFEGLERDATRLVTPAIRNVAPDQGGRLGPGRLPPVLRALVPGGDRLDDSAHDRVSPDQNVASATRRAGDPVKQVRLIAGSGPLACTLRQSIRLPPERSACRSATRGPQTRMIRYSTRRQRASTATWRRTWSTTWCCRPGSLNRRPCRLKKFGRSPSTGVLGFHRT